MFSIEKNSLESPPKVSKKVESSTTYNKDDHKCVQCSKYYRRCKCNQKMYSNCNNILTMIMVLIIFYMLCKLMCSNTEEPSNAFRLVRRY